MTALHINRGTGKHYRVRARLPGGRKWHLLKPFYRTHRAALRALAHRARYDMEPVNGGLVEPGWVVTPLPLRKRRAA